MSISYLVYLVYVKNESNFLIQQYIINHENLFLFCDRWLQFSICKRKALPIIINSVNISSF